MFRHTLSLFCVLGVVGCGAGTSITTTTTTDGSTHADGLSKVVASQHAQANAWHSGSNLGDTLANAAASDTNATGTTADAVAVCTADAAAAAGAHGVCLCGSMTPAAPSGGGHDNGGDNNGGHNNGGGSCHPPPSIGRHHTLARHSNGNCGSTSTPAQPSCTSLKKWPTDPNADTCPCDPTEAASLEDDIGEAAADANITITALDANHLGTAITLAAGYYLVPGIKTQRALSITASGAVRLYVSGDLQVHGALGLTPSSGATLDVWVQGKITTDGALQAGLASAPTATHLYVAGTQISLGKASRIDGQLFAPIATIKASQGLEIHGSLLAASVHDSGSTTVCYDADLTTPPFSCLAPTPPVQPANPTPPTPVTCGACNFDCGALTCGVGVVCVPCDDATLCCNGRMCQAGSCVANN